MTEPTDFENRKSELEMSVADGRTATGQDVPVLEARSLYKTYKRGEVDVTAVESVALAVRRAEFVAVMGPSGAGKSTLLYLLGGLERPSAGDLRLGGQTLTELSGDELALFRRRRIGFIFQFCSLIPTLTAEENLALPLTIGGADLVEHRPRIDALLYTVGLWSRRDHKPAQPLGILLSLGMTRRQIIKVVLAESAAMGIVAALLGLGLGLVVSQALIRGANIVTGYRFGYTFSAIPLVLGPVLCQLAGLYPGWRATQTNIVEAIKQE